MYKDDFQQRQAFETRVGRANPDPVALVAAVPAGAPLIIAPGGRAAIPTGLAIALSAGIGGQIRPRSGLAL